MGKRFELHFWGPESPLADAARELEQQVFLERFASNTPDLMAAEYGPYEDASRYIVVIDREHAAGPKVSGMIRIIADGPAGFKSINDLGRDPWNVPPEEVISGDPELRAIYDPDKTWDIATLAIASEYRASRSTEGAQTSLALFHCLCREAINTGKECGVTVLDDIVLNQVIQPLGHAFEKYADPRLGSREYLDSPGSTPMYCDFLDFRDRVRREQPDVFAALFEGRGIEDFTDIPLSEPVDPAGLRLGSRIRQR